MKKLSIPDWFFFLLLVSLTLVFYKILTPYLIDIFLAIILAHLMRGVFMFFNDKVGNKTLASTITVFLTVFLIIIPILLVGIILANEVIRIYSTVINSIPNIEAAFNNIGNIPMLQPLFEANAQVNLMEALSDLIRGSAGYIVNFTSQAVIGIGINVFHLFIICFLIFFLYIDGERLLKKVLYLSPLDDKEEQQLLDEVITITDATLLGTLLIGVIEGVFGASVFVFFGIASPVFWGVAIMILSVIPIVGTIFIMVPAGIFLIVSGSWVSGLVVIVLAYGGTTITQNYMKPFFVSRRAGPHPAIILLSTLGGLAWFGPVGFVIGPVFASLFIGIWEQFGMKYKEELDQWNRGKRDLIEETFFNDVY